MGVVEALITRHFHADEVGTLKRFVLAGKLNFSHHQALIGPVELINLKDVGATLYQPAALVYHAAASKGQQVVGFVER